MCNLVIKYYRISNKKSNTNIHKNNKVIKSDDKVNNFIIINEKNRK